MSDFSTARNLVNAQFELWAWQRSNTGCFSNMLFELISKADLWNRERIRRGFPEYVAAFEEWEHSKTPNELVAKWGERANV